MENQVAIPLRAKLGITLFLAVAAFLSVDHWLRQRAFSSTFEAIEQGRAELQVAEVRHAIDDIVDELSGEAQRLDEASIGDALAEVGHRVDMALIVGIGGVVHALEVRDPSSRAPITLRELPTEQISPSHPLLSPWLSRSLPKGIFETELGFLLVGSAQVGSGKDSRLMITGQFLTPSRRAELGALTSLEVEFVSLRGRSSLDSTVVTQESVFQIQGKLAMGGTVIVPDGGHGAAVGAIDDLRGLPTIAVAVEMAEPVWKQLESYALLTSAGVAIVFPLVLLILLQFLVTGPLSKLTSMATAIAASDDRTLRVRMLRRDEIGRLSHKFDAMLDEIERARLAESRTARTVGRSEIAVGVMHNVGNLVNSVRVSAALARDGASSVQVDDLRLILAALRANEGNLDRYLCDDPKGAHLLEFFEMLVLQLESARQTTVGESDAVLEQVGEITDMVQSLLGETSPEEALEVIDVDREIDAAIEAAQSEFGPASGSGGGLASRTRYESGGQLEGRVDRLRVHEVLLSLLANAWDAASSGQGDPNIHVHSESLGQGLVRIVVNDNGPGLSAECGEEIYSMGFTTRTGRAGLGLHLASLAASDLGGTIHILPPTESISNAQRGPLKGASFAFDFPLRSAVQAPRL